MRCSSACRHRCPGTSRSGSELRRGDNALYCAASAARPAGRPRIRRPIPGPPAKSCSRSSSGRGSSARGAHFFLAYSPEREDQRQPADFVTGDIPKVVGGDGPDALPPRRCAVRRGGGADGAGDLAPRSGRGGKADGEHLSLGQHRPGQRVEDRVRGDGHRHLGGHRGGQDQAVRLYAVLPRPRGSAGTASRSIRST